MTANTLSNSDRAKVARAVSGSAWLYSKWRPAFKGSEKERSQALALVEYLADSGDSNYQSGAIRCVQRRDVEGLMQLAHQMITKKSNDAPQPYERRGLAG